jgi:hypothetical protein
MKLLSASSYVVNKYCVKRIWGELINEHSKTINKQMSIFCVTFKEPTKPISYLEAELKTTSLDLNVLILLVKKSIQGEICPSDLLFNFLEDEHLTGRTNFNNFNL